MNYFQIFFRLKSIKWISSAANIENKGGMRIIFPLKQNDTGHWAFSGMERELMTMLNV